MAISFLLVGVEVKREALAARPGLPSELLGAEPVSDFRRAPPSPKDWYRDAVLCPQHARELERLFKPTGRELDRPQGRA
jgi:hypothetical protein